MQKYSDSLSCTSQSGITWKDRKNCDRINSKEKNNIYKDLCASVPWTKAVLKAEGGQTKYFIQVHWSNYTIFENTLT